MVQSFLHRRSGHSCFASSAEERPDRAESRAFFDGTFASANEVKLYNSSNLECQSLRAVLIEPMNEKEHGTGLYCNVL